MKRQPIGLLAFVSALALLVSGCGGSNGGTQSTDGTEAETSASPGTEAETSASPGTEAETSASPGTEEATAAAPGEDLTIAVAFPGDAPYLDGYRRGLEQAAEERGVTLEVLNAGWEAATQAEQMSQLTSSGPDGLIVWAVDQTAICSSIASTAQAGIPIVASNSEVDESCSDQLVAYTGPDDEAQGCEAAGLVEDAIGEGNVIVIEGVPGTAPQIRRLAGFEECLADGITILDQQPANWDRGEAVTVTRDLLTRHGEEVDAIFGQDDTMAVGAAEAVQEAGLDIPVVGLGGSGAGLEAVANGELFGTMVQSPVFDGEFAVNAIVDHLEGKDVEPVQFLPIPVVTKDNVDEFEAEW